jgi:CHAT domain-containing protein
LEIVALPGEVVIFAISENDVAVGRRARFIETLAALGDAALVENGTAAASALYDDIIRPVEGVLARARQLVIVPDTRLRAAPFAALYDADTHRHLIDRFPVSIASSASSLTRVSARTNAPSLVAIELPAAGRAPALPEAEREIGEVAAAYRTSRSIASTGATIEALRDAAAEADVLHIAGHTESQSGGGEHVFLVNDETVSWKTVLAGPRIHAAIVVLSACETLRSPASAATHGQTLGAAFAAAGAADVFGTLAPIGDRDARLLFRALHRRLADAADPADALRAVVRDAIGNDRDGRHAWRAIALLTNRIQVSNRTTEDLPWIKAK